MSANVLQINGLYGGDAKGLYTGGGGVRHGFMIYGKPNRKWPKILIIVLIIALIVAACIWIFVFNGLGLFNNNSKEEKKEVAAIAALDNYISNIGNGATTTVVVSAVGDCTLGTDVNFDSSTSFESVYKTKNDPSYFFGNTVNFLNKDQLSICNFEGTLSNQGERQSKQFAFRGSPDYTKILTSGSIEGANLANNHSFDYGNAAYEDTKKALTEANITNFGYDRVNIFETNGVKIGLFGVCSLDNLSGATDTMKKDIEALKKENVNMIIGCFHWGVEGSHDVAEDRKTLAHSAIDLGCDLVLGTHPHVIQGVEKYKNRYICYSLGNFCFGGNDNPGEYDTMIFQQAFTFRNGQLVMDDSTLNNIDVVPCTVSSKTSTNDYCPTAQSGDTGAAIITRLNSYSENLGESAVKFNTPLNDDGTASIVGKKTTALNPSNTASTSQ